MSYTLVLEWMPGDLYMSAVTARCTAPTSSYSVVWLPPNKVYQITLYCGSTSLVSFLVGAFRGKAWSYMSKAFIVLWMIFFHIVDDYYLQGWLASAKQKKWWEDNAPQTLYKYDYIWALLMHSFSWAFMIMLPIAVTMSFNISWFFLVYFLLNVFVHALVDDLKANRKKINLWHDQLIHMSQIAVTAIVMLF